MSKKLTLSLVAVAVVIAGVALTSAYEAHIINVTAHIENALSVNTKALDFGTVFPQEYLANQEFTISLSESFMKAERVDDVEYDIVQKPKPLSDPYAIIEPTEVGSIVAHEFCLKYPEHPDYLQYCYRDLCPYLSKINEEDDDDEGTEENDTDAPSYFIEGKPDTCNMDPGEANGTLSKIALDTEDRWVIDLKVPPFEGYVAQDWPADCPVIQGDPNGTDFGCDLWIEVTEISLPPSEGVCGDGVLNTGEECDDGNNIDGDGCSANCTREGICAAKPDVMQVFDRSGSISPTELATLKVAAHGFVTALDPKELGAWMGQTSFATTGTLDLGLSHDKPTIDAKIDSLVSTGLTNLYEGLMHANQELANHSRSGVDSPDFLVVITDGEPNEPGTNENARAQAKAQADAADTAGTIIYVIGVGTTSTNAVWLRDNIATSPSHYFDASNWDALQAILQGIATCQPI